MNKTIVKSFFIAILFLKYYSHCDSNVPIELPETEEQLERRVNKTIEKIDQCGPYESANGTIFLSIFENHDPGDQNFSNYVHYDACVQFDTKLAEFFREKLVLFKYMTKYLYDIYQQILEEKDNNLYKVLNILIEEVDETFKHCKYKSAIDDCMQRHRKPLRADQIPQHLKSLCSESSSTQCSFDSIG